mmetsp:Transcript_8482/g.14975  ORF Transcript_8482/g.14975 Transcript_8482/m.14975 type:complete len:252 (-) Transcript_8482:103-858(-)
MQESCLHSCLTMFIHFILDIESTGLDVVNDRITQIAIKRSGSTNPSDRLIAYVNPGREIPSNVVELTGITNEFIQNGGHCPATGMVTGPALSLPAVLPILISFMRNQIKVDEEACLVAHNGNQFDFPLLQNEIARTKLPISLSDIATKTLDTIVIFRSSEIWSTSDLSKPAHFNLAGLHRHVHGPESAILNHHNALADVDTLERLLMRFPSWEITANEFLQGVEDSVEDSVVHYRKRAKIYPTTTFMYIYV